MKVLGVTGGVGAGKSTVLAYMQTRYGARAIQADEVGRMLQQPGQECYRQIVAAFGPGILKEDGTLRRSALAALVFQDKRKLRRLNGIMHPAVRSFIMQEIQTERERGRIPFAVIEAALLLEDHYDAICDEIWYLYADSEVRIRRLMESRSYSRDRALEIMSNQLSDEEYRSRCQLIIDNSSNFVENTFGQIDKGLIEHGFL